MPGVQCWAQQSSKQVNKRCHATAACLPVTCLTLMHSYTLLCTRLPCLICRLLSCRWELSGSWRPRCCSTPHCWTWSSRGSRPWCLAASTWVLLCGSRICLHLPACSVSVSVCSALPSVTRHMSQCRPCIPGLLTKKSPFSSILRVLWSPCVTAHPRMQNYRVWSCLFQSMLHCLLLRPHCCCTGLRH